MTQAIAITRVSIRQILGLRRLIGLGLLSIAPGGIFFLSSGTQSATSALRNFGALSAGLMFSVAIPVVSLIMASTSLGDERRDKTLSFITLRPIPRIVIAIAKYAAAVIAAFALTGIGALVLSATLGLRTGDWGYVFPLLVGTFVATVAYTALFMPLGYLTERATLIGLAFVFIWESAIAGTLPALAGSSPWRIGYSAFVGLAPDNFLEIVDDVRDFALGDLMPGAGGALFKILVLAAISIGVTTLILQRRDLT